MQNNICESEIYIINSLHGTSSCLHKLIVVDSAYQHACMYQLSKHSHAMIMIFYLMERSLVYICDYKHWVLISQNGLRINKITFLSLSYSYQEWI